ncbi:MAG: glycosyl transferase family 2 [Deltaproteobacteria bacterium RBG_16_48_10]|nr:MAG: glycosyl transferase family 2 [Deltaproteobacteria bacterium RBG_16_48_10]
MKDLGKQALVLIPAYNEEARITSVVRGVKERYSSLEVVVIDDGSSDETRKRAIEAGACVISHPYNLGYGVALQTGYLYALREGYEALVQMDGDGQHDPAYILVLMDQIQRGNTDLVIGSRFLEREGCNPECLPYRAPIMRRCGMRLFGTIASLIIRRKVTDPTSGYQAMNREVLEWVSSDKFPWDYPDADLIIMLHRAGFRIQEVPVQMYENLDKKSMHSGWKPLYYVFKMFLSILVTLMRK